LRAIKHFSRWLLKDRRNVDDPLAPLSMLNVQLDKKRVRRPITSDEFAAIRQAALNGPIVRRMSGPDRAMLYPVAAYTGLRASELASLTRMSFELDCDHPIVRVEAAYSKHRREDVLPLHPSLVDLLRPWLATKNADERVWPGKWAEGKEAAAMLKHDLAKAGIPYKDESGRYADFHALRKTFITNMVKAGVTPKSAQAEIGAIRLASDTSESAPNCTEKGKTSRSRRSSENAKNPVENGVICTNSHQGAPTCTAEREGNSER
jgi:integrase